MATGPTPENPLPPPERGLPSEKLVALLVAGGAAALAAALLSGGAAILCAGLAAIAGTAWGFHQGAAEQERATRLRLYRVADELVQYRAFTRLLRAQGERITGLTDDAALTIAAGLQAMDQDAAALAEGLAGGLATGLDAAACARLRGQALRLGDPVLGMVGKLQFQDVTRQQLAFLARLSEIVDAHMAELAHLLGDRRSLDRTTHFKELFEQALDETVMESQRNDHRSAAGPAAEGLEFFEAAGPAVELFFDDEVRTAKGEAG